MKWIVDLDGVVYRGQELLPGAVEFFQCVRALGQPSVVVTNNSTLPVDDYVKRLADWGIGVTSQQVVTSALAAAHYLLRHGIRGPVLAIGEAGLTRALDQAGLVFISGDEAAGDEPFEAVVVGLDRRFDYRKLELACRWVRRGARFVGTNPDAVLPTENGQLRPGCGSLLAAIQAASGVQPVVVGKPYPDIMHLALERLGQGPAPSPDVVVVGDRLDTDVEAARRMGLASALVLTGVTTPEQVSGLGADRPDYVFRDLAHLTEVLLRPRLTGA